MKINNTRNWLKLTLFLCVLLLTTGIQPIKALPEGFDQPIAENPSSPGSTRKQETPNDVLQQGVTRDPIVGTPRGQGGSRGECNRPDTFAHLPQVTLLQPRERSQATTNQAFPTFLVYVPYDLTDSSPGRFVLEKSTGELVHEFVSRSNSGNSILAVTIPSEPSKALTEGDSYLVSFRVYCNDPTMSNSTALSARARVQRNASTAESAWYDQLSTAYQTGNQSQWRSLLDAEGLGTIPAALSADNQ